MSDEGSSAMDMLLLDDPRWNDLDHRGWYRGRRYELSPDAPYVPDELAELLKKPADIERFGRLWPWLCSEGTTWAAAYAAAPYTVELARRLPAEERFEHLFFVGLVAMCSCPENGDSFEIKPYLVKGYETALTQALHLLAETIICRHHVTETRYLLAAAAALKGHRKLGHVLNNLDCISEQCPMCGQHVYPHELEEAVNAAPAASKRTGVKY